MDAAQYARKIAGRLKAKDAGQGRALVEALGWGDDFENDDELAAWVYRHSMFVPVPNYRYNIAAVEKNCNRTDWGQTAVAFQRKMLREMRAGLALDDAVNDWLAAYVKGDLKTALSLTLPMIRAANEYRTIQEEHYPSVLDDDDENLTEQAKRDRQRLMDHDRQRSLKAIQDMRSGLRKVVHEQEVQEAD